MYNMLFKKQCLNEFTATVSPISFKQITGYFQSHAKNAICNTGTVFKSYRTTKNTLVIIFNALINRTFGLYRIYIKNIPEAQNFLKLFNVRDLVN